MSQLYDFSYSEYEDSQRWVLEGPDMDQVEFEQLWVSLISQAAKEVNNVFGAVYETDVLRRVVKLLVEKHSFSEIHASHNKHFNFGSREVVKEFFKYVPKEFYKGRRKFNKEVYDEEL